MIIAISTGFLAIFLVALWLAARTGIARQSALLGLMAGLVGYVLLLVAYLAGLTLWARAQLIAFIQTELPVLLERLREPLDQLLILRESI